MMNALVLPHCCCYSLHEDCLTGCWSPSSNYLVCYLPDRTNTQPVLPTTQLNSKPLQQLTTTFAQLQTVSYAIYYYEYCYSYYWLGLTTSLKQPAWPRHQNYHPNFAQKSTRLVTNW